MIKKLFCFTLVVILISCKDSPVESAAEEVVESAKPVEEGRVQIENSDVFKTASSSIKYAEEVYGRDSRIK